MFRKLLTPTPFPSYRYKLFMQTYISDRLPEAQRGGVPSVFNLVSSYVALNFNNQTGNTIGLQDGHIDGKPLWPMVYYSLRCGSIQSALKCLQQTGYIIFFFSFSNSFFISLYCFFIVLVMMI